MNFRGSRVEQADALVAAREALIKDLDADIADHRAALKELEARRRAVSGGSPTAAARARGGKSKR